MAAQTTTDTLCHLLAGGCSGTVAAIATSPLEVLKTRMQSSPGLSGRPGTVAPPGLLRALRSILEKEGPRSLFRGLGPILVGVAPSRAIYFAAYSKSKEAFNGVFVPDSGAVHASSAGLAAFVTNTLTNPVWMVKTRMQLENNARGEQARNALQCARHVYRTEGVQGFYRGLTASYAGISETVICFLIYEKLKKRIIAARRRVDSPTRLPEGDRGAWDFLKLMMAAAVSRGCASCVGYPHEVVRTRLREEGSKYRHLFQTARLIMAEEGLAAFYRGLLPQLVRQIPNTAIVLSSYELIVYLLGKSK